MLELTSWPRNTWSVFDELESLQSDMNDLFSTWYGGRPRSGARRYGTGRGQRYPLMNVWSSVNGVIIDAELPGVDPKDVDISVQGDELVLRGKVNAWQAAEGETCHRRERPAGEFARRLQLPFRAEPNAVKAAYSNGVLRLTLPRPEEEKPRKIAIDVA